MQSGILGNQGKAVAQFDFNRKIYSGDPKTARVRFSNGQKWVGCQMVRFSIGFAFENWTKSPDFEWFKPTFKLSGFRMLGFRIPT